MKKGLTLPIHLLFPSRIVLSELKKILKILGLERSGKKEEVVERVMAFMSHPEDCGKKPLKVKVCYTVLS